MTSNDVCTVIKLLFGLNVITYHVTILLNASAISCYWETVYDYMFCLSYVIGCFIYGVFRTIVF